MSETKRTVVIEDRRPGGEEAIAKTGRIYAARLVEQGVTVDDLGSETCTPTDDDRDVIAAVRAVLAETAKFTVTQRPDEVVEEPVAPASHEALEKLNDVERACLESMKEDFNRGIVCIDDNADKDAYQAALGEDKTAGQSWETVQGRLLANEAVLLKNAVELSKLTGN